MCLYIILFFIPDPEEYGLVSCPVPTDHFNELRGQKAFLRVLGFNLNYMALTSVKVSLEFDFFKASVIA